MATRERDGATSRRSCNRLPSRSGAIELSPVKLPPGRARFCTTDCDHDERYLRGLLFNRKRSRRPGGNDHVYFRSDEFGDERRKPLVFSVRPKVVDDNISSFLVAKLT